MNILRCIKNIITVVFIAISLISLLFSYMPIYEYEGEGANVPDIVSSDAVLLIIIFIALSIFFAIIAFLLNLKKRYALYIFIIILAINIYRIIQIKIVMDKVDNGILPIM